MKDRFIVNPFEELSLTSSDRTMLEDLANRCILTNLELSMKYMSNTKRTVDPHHWKLLKENDMIKVFSERTERAAAAVASGNEATGFGLPMLLGVGNVEGKLDDVMFGVTCEDLETMRIKALSVDDMSGAAVLESLVHELRRRAFGLSPRALGGFTTNPQFAKPRSR